MDHRDAARHVGFDIIDTRRCRCEEGLQQKREGGGELWNEVLNLLSSKILCCFLLLLFHHCCAPLRPPLPSFFTLARLSYIMYC
ncbi:hypothetical protein RchiOBHm_Chr5g0051481 [Rosa chinensis]|uniref:Uncharacterized protein n=1 Tax=Rosa chinensis TaxID=74649 RepID=A0A2P6QFD2_ROSCH|nr:hypothetical protein RchiOBHm_Chr5g0051481 [Rosa chinensis]